MPTFGLAELADMAGPVAKRVFYRFDFATRPPMDRKLLDILVCPASRQPLALLDKAGLDALNAAIAAGALTRVDGGAQATPLREALVTHDRKLVYRIDDGIPVLLVEDGIATGQIPDFPKA